MSEKKPNHICKNPACRRKYYSCDYCDRTQRWQSVACSWDCYLKYQDAVIEARSKGEDISLLPERLDKSREEIIDLMHKPSDAVLKETKDDLKDYLNDDASDFSEAVKKVNEELDGKTVVKRNTRQKKSSVHQ